MSIVWVNVGLLLSKVLVEALLASSVLVKAAPSKVASQVLTKAAAEPFHDKPAAEEVCFESRRNLEMVELLFTRGEGAASARGLSAVLARGLSASDPPRLLLEASYVP